jgi:adenosylcobinamide-phosphate synthase
MFFELALIALLIEAATGYPDALFRRIGHPVTWIGVLIARCERAWNQTELSQAQRRLLGVCTLIVVAAAVALAGWLLAELFAQILPSTIALFATALAASTLLAQRSLYHHVLAVADALERDGLNAGRVAVSQIVGRDTCALDAAGVGRAAIESLAENFSDGVVAPLFWLAALGLPGAATYKAVNTADSMIGHKSERYLAFGWAAARLDDLVNLPASRLSGIWLVLAAALLPAFSAREAAAAVRRDARHHRSPNAGWPEAAMAGALGIRLAGPRTYASERVDDAWMGDGRTEASVSDIRRALKLYQLACAIQIVVVAILAALTLFG